MESVSNLVWLVTSVLLMLLAYRQSRHSAGVLRVRMALVTTGVLMFVLLPTFSTSDDVLEMQQAALPVAAQTWHLASAGASAGEDLATVVVCLLLPDAPRPREEQIQRPARSVRRQAEWLTRAQRLRPPLSAAA